MRDIMDDIINGIVAKGFDYKLTRYQALMRAKAAERQARLKGQAEAAKTYVTRKQAEDSPFFQYVDAREVMRITGVSRTRIFQLVESGLLPHIEIKQKYYFKAGQAYKIICLDKPKRIAAGVVLKRHRLLHKAPSKKINCFISKKAEDAFYAKRKNKRRGGGAII